MFEIKSFVDVVAHELLRAEAKLQASAVEAAAKRLASDPDDPAYKPVDTPRANNVTLRKVSVHTDPMTKQESNVSGVTYLRD